MSNHISTENSIEARIKQASESKAISSAALKRAEFEFCKARAILLDAIRAENAAREAVTLAKQKDRGTGKKTWFELAMTAYAELPPERNDANIAIQKTLKALDIAKRNDKDADEMLEEIRKSLLVSNPMNDIGGSLVSSDNKKRAVSWMEQDTIESDTHDVADITTVKSIEVFGCGIANANGTYRRRNTGSKNHVFENQSCCLLMLSNNHACWEISSGTKSLYVCLPRGYNDNKSLLNREWIIAVHGVNPPPKLEVKD